MDVLHELARVMESRKGADPEASYVATLFGQGLESILAKLEEETSETVEAAQSDDDDWLIRETADLWFHSLVLLSFRGLGPQHVLSELRQRFGISGHIEKAGRTD